MKEYIEKSKGNLRDIQGYIESLEGDDVPTGSEEWFKIIKCLKESTRISANYLDLIERYEEKMDTVEDNVGSIEKKTNVQEFRTQQFEDKGQRALDFIDEHGLHEKFRRYYEKNKQSNVVAFPQED